MMKYKRGDLAISTIILIVLGLMVLIGTLYMLMAQKGIFRESVDAVSSDTNVDEFVLACNDLVSLEKSFSYCCEKKKVDTGKDNVEGSCFDLKDEGFIGGRIDSLDCSAIEC